MNMEHNSFLQIMPGLKTKVYKACHVLMDKKDQNDREEIKAIVKFKMAIRKKKHDWAFQGLCA